MYHTVHFFSVIVAMKYNNFLSLLQLFGIIIDTAADCYGSAPAERWMWAMSRPAPIWTVPAS